MAPLTNADRKQMQLDLMWTAINDNELLPYSPIKSLNKQLITDNKSFIKSINEVMDKLKINDTTVTNFNANFNTLIGNRELEVADWNNLKKIDRNVIRAIYKVYLNVEQLIEDMDNHKHTLTDITDVDVTNKINGYALQYDSVAGKFISKPLPTENGGSGSSVSDSTTNGNILIDDIEVNVYTHPTNHPASIITQDANNRFVTDAEKTTWNAKAEVSNVYTKSETDDRIQSIINAAPAALDTLSELAIALGNDANFSTTITNSLANKVDKISGKGLSESDFTITEKTKLSGISSNANNYVHPANHSASIISQDSNNRFVTDAEKTTWNAKASTSIVTTLVDGLMSSVDKTKLDGIATGANNYVHPANHHASVITQDVNNRFVTDAEKTAWNSLISTVSTLQSQLADALARIGVLELDTSAEVEWTYDFIIPQSTGIYTLTSNGAWNHTLTTEDVYGPALDGLNSKMKLLTLGVEDGAPNEPGLEVPRDGFDSSTAPSMHGKFQYDEGLQQITFQSGAMNPYYFRIIKYV
jgi:hypothetical protein